MREESAEIQFLRKQAKQLSKATGEKHTKCLHEIARTKGYKSWERLLEAKKDE
jgi:hypothetical protein